MNNESRIAIDLSRKMAEDIDKTMARIGDLLGASIHDATEYGAAIISVSTAASFTTLRALQIALAMVEDNKDVTLMEAAIFACLYQRIGPDGARKAGKLVSDHFERATKGE